MKEYEDYTYREFVQLDPVLINKYMAALTSMESIPTKNLVEDLTLNQVEEIKQGIYIESEWPTIFSYVEDITPEEFQDMGIFTLFPKYESIKEQLADIIDKEDKYLQPAHSNLRWEMVNGSERIKRFGILPMVDNLAKGDILKWDEVLNMKYSTVFRKLMYDTVMGDLEYEMSKVKTKSE